MEDDAVEFAAEARVSLIANPYDCATETVNTMLENYFLHPRYLHVNDVIKIDVREYAQDRFYSSGSPAIPAIYFAVKSLKLYHDDGHVSSVNSCYAVRGETALIQEAQVHRYIPRKHVSSFPGNVSVRQDDEKIRRLLNDKCPPALKESLEYIEYCITPFLQEGIIYAYLQIDST